jgi:hypothetical protein
MKRIVSAIAVFAVSAVVAGCGYTELHEVILRSPSGPTARDPDVYMLGQAVPRAFYEIALLQVIGHGSDATLEDLIGALGQRGRQLGCDAVANVHFDQGYSMAHAYAVCVKYARVQAPAAASPAPSAPPAKPAPEAAPPAADPDEDGTSL